MLDTENKHGNVTTIEKIIKTWEIENKWTTTCSTLVSRKVVKWQQIHEQCRRSLKIRNLKEWQYTNQYIIF